MQHIFSKLKPKTIKRQLILGVALVHAILMTIFVYDLVSREQEFLLNHSEEQATSLAHTISTNSINWILSNNISGLNEIVKSQKEYPNLDFVMITSTDGEVLAHTDKNIVGKYLVDKSSIRMLESKQETIQLKKSLTHIDVAHRVEFNGRTLGWIRVSLSTKSVTDNLEEIVLEGILYTFAAIFLGSLIAWLLSNSLTKRIRELIEATKEVKPDQVNTEFLSVAEDEVGELMTNFNLMEKKLATQFAEMQNMAYSDSLTSLNSRAYFDIAFKKTIQGCIESEKYCGLVIVDVDNFKQLNDSYGHDVGDQLLVETAQRIQSFINKHDHAFRFGGDEFVLLLNNLNPLTSKGVLESLVFQLHELISEPCQLGSIIYTPQFSIGIHIIDLYSPKKEAFKKADIALYNAKRRGKGQISFFLPEMEAEIKKYNYYEQGLKTALQNNELSWVIQPQINMQTNTVIGGEVLMRWKYKDEFVRPDIFIPITEDNQTIIPISNWLFDSVFAWVQQNNIPNMKVSLNLSPVHFFDSNLVPFLNELLYKYQISPYNIKLEVTEGIFLERMDYALSIISKLKGVGFRISLDDFGTGFSSLSYLKNLPIDQLKIDKSFVDGLPDNEKPAAIAKTIIDLTQNLELNVIAEGVETEEQKEFLIENQCIHCQGYLYSKPLPPSEFLKFIDGQL